jgi:hypothetical protein
MGLQQRATNGNAIFQCLVYSATYMLGPKLQQAGGFPSNDASNKCQNWFPIIASVHQDNG